MSAGRQIVASDKRTAPPTTLSPKESLAIDAAIAAVRPDLSRTGRTIHATGWDCAAVEVGGTLFKFARTDAARNRLRGEPVRLRVFARHAAITVPTMTLHETPTLFSEHALIPGTMVDPARYHRFGEIERDRLADDLARAYVAAHGAGPAALAAGIGPVKPWPSARTVFDALAPRLEPALLAHASDMLGRIAAAPADIAVFGHFDTHGWNMAYDTAAGRLAGLFDFGDAGIGPRHRDLSYPSFVSPDLTARTVARYQALSGAIVDLDRVFDLHAVLRLIEIANAGEGFARFVWALTDWLAALERHRASAGRAGQAAGALVADALNPMTPDTI